MMYIYRLRQLFVLCHVNVYSSLAEILHYIYILHSRFSPNTSTSLKLSMFGDKRDSNTSNITFGQAGIDIYVA
jgi:hypothetical protein